MNEFGQDPLIERVAHELRRPVRVDPSLDRRVMVEVGRLGQPSMPRRVRGWLLRPRRVVVSPAWGLAIAAGLALLVVVSPDGAPTMRRDGLAESGDVQRLTSFRFVAPGASEVFLAGDFNDWNHAATPMRLLGADTWAADVELPPGRYEYTFVIDGVTWVTDPGAPPAANSDFGIPSSVVMVPEA
ncbi:MAG: isoamylase early set domain-containing protein [Gemmatimonadales bacterium]